MTLITVDQTHLALRAAGALTERRRLPAATPALR